MVSLILRQSASSAVEMSFISFEAELQAVFLCPGRLIPRHWC
jgi:hypothetical protein